MRIFTRFLFIGTFCALPTLISTTSEASFWDILRGKSQGANTTSRKDDMGWHGKREMRQQPSEKASRTATMSTWGTPTKKSPQKNKKASPKMPWERGFWGRLNDLY